MCGIAGVLIPLGLAPVMDLDARVGKMTSAIAHRGPDDKGVWTKDNRVALGHRRLSVIDLSPAAHQPMTSSQGDFCVAFNGEIYNFQSLRKELEADGFVFRSLSDTEVILNGYRKWGAELFTRLRGMFALAIWDGERKQLVLARDRIGKKPLFYGWHEGRLFFGSEIKSILSWPGMPREPDLQAIHHYLSYQYVPGPWSAFKGIRKLPQASYMVITMQGTHSINKYWSLPSPAAAKKRSLKTLKAELIEHLDEAVRIRMIADVPVGAFLSGGVDSSAVTAFMARHSSGPVQTFCIGFDEQEYDERRYARLVADRYGTDHHEMTVRPDAISVLPRITWHYGEPFADPSAVPTYYVSEIARRHVTVALNGDGGDESFLGYGRYRQCLQTEWVSRIPRTIRRRSGSIAAKIPSAWDRHKAARVVRRALNVAAEKNAVRYAPSIVYFFEQDKDLGYGAALREQLADSSLSQLDRWFDEAPSFVAGAAWADIHTYLPDDLLVKVDIASMAHALEARSPFLDHVVMEWAAGIPASQKIAGGETKAILKSAMEPFLPQEILYRPKMGFGVPVDRWLRSELKEFAYDILLSDSARSRQLIRPEYVENLLDEHCEGARLHHTRLWGLLMLELWYRMWIDSASAPLTPPAEANIDAVESAA
jgi:asparagine synthase (glutamine-hydrolysing)